MNPIILYDNRFKDGVPSATDTAAGFDVLHIRDLRPYTLWRAANSGAKYLTVDCGSAKSADSVAIISHNLQTASASVSVESSADGDSWTERLAPFSPESDKAFLKLFTPTTARYWRVKIVTETLAAQVGICMIGARLDFPFPADTPFIPYSIGVEADSSTSKAGFPLGSVIRYKPIHITPRFSVLERTFVFGAYKEFWTAHYSELRAFVWAWDLGAYPDDVFLVWAAESPTFEPPLSFGTYADFIELRMTGVLER